MFTFKMLFAGFAWLLPFATVCQRSQVVSRLGTVKDILCLIWIFKHLLIFGLILSLFRNKELTSQGGKESNEECKVDKVESVNQEKTLQR